MKGIFALARAHVIAGIREKDTLFWFLVFPLFLLTILTLIFGRLGQDPEIHFTIALIDREAASSDAAFSPSAIVRELFSSLTLSETPGERPLFSLRTPASTDALDAFQEKEIEQLRRGNRAAVLVIPPGFDRNVLQSLQAGGQSPQPSVEAGLQLYMSQTSVASETAAAIIEQILAGLDRNLLAQMGLYDEAASIDVVTEWTQQEQADSEVPYVNYVLPSIVLMGFFTTGLFGVPGTILYNREGKVLRQYWVTPLSVRQYLLGFGVGHVIFCAIQFALVLLLGRLAFGATLQFSSWHTVLLLILASATFLAFGFLITSFARSANGGMAIANILNMPMMFLSGMFFPIVGLPIFLMILVYANPVTYVLEALRQSVGIQAGTLMPWPWPVLVPLLWILVCSAVAVRRLRWDVGS